MHQPTHPENAEPKSTPVGDREAEELDDQDSQEPREAAGPYPYKGGGSTSAGRGGGKNVVADDVTAAVPRFGVPQRRVGRGGGRVESGEHVFEGIP